MLTYVTVFLSELLQRLIDSLLKSHRIRSRYDLVQSPIMQILVFRRAGNRKLIDKLSLLANNVNELLFLVCYYGAIELVRVG